MIKIKNKIAIQKMKIAGQKLKTLFTRIGGLSLINMTTLELDSWIEKAMVQEGLHSKMKGYMGYKYVSCISINNQVVHGMPSGSKVIKAKDLVKVDVCVSFDGYSADMARMFYSDTLMDEPVKKLIKVAQSALDKGIEMMRPGKRLSDISAAIEQEIQLYSFGIVQDFAGHGIGKNMHEEPEILNYGKPGNGPVLQAGMVFALEPMITLGSPEVYIDKDGWTVNTTDGSMAAHVEDTIVITQGDPEILTR